MNAQKKDIDPTNIPRHIAIVMDGNGRWAKNKGAARIFGHRNAVNAVRATMEGCVELKVDFLTLYAFSVENWGRPKNEIEALMKLLVEMLQKELVTLHKNGVCLKTVGDLERLPNECKVNLQDAVVATQHNTGLTVVLALSYSGRWEIVQAIRRLVADVKKGDLLEHHITEKAFSNYLTTAGIPDPELLIRTGGEMRVSNFLLWQIAYTELYITNIMWPDFDKKALYSAIQAYQARDRRFGKIKISGR